MREGRPSTTAQRVAAYRLGFDRLDAPYGDPAADEALARDVAGPAPAEGNELMGRHLRARTNFFDRVTVSALERGVAQVVVVGAGYDGRALRYAKPGVRWWEVDHPDTQADKRGRLDRLGLAHRHVTFVRCDLEVGGLDGALADAGFQPDAPALFSCEGVALYLSPVALADTLADLRSLAAPGTRLALSVSLPPATAARQASRARLHAALAAMGEPATATLTEDSLADLLTGSRWRPVALSEKAQRAGFVVATPEWVPAGAGRPPSRGRLAGFAERMTTRAGGATLPGHLAATYGVTVRGSRELDVGVHRIDLAGGGSWIARIFPANRPVAAARQDAELLGWLGVAGFPAERCPVADPVSVHDDQAVLVTERVPGRALSSAPASFELLGRLLAQLHALPVDGPVDGPADGPVDGPADPPARGRPGGGWHHLVPDGTAADEISAARGLLHDARHLAPAADAGRYDQLVAAVDIVDHLLGRPDVALPEALVHADLVPRNAIRSPAGDVVVIDWAGAGRGSRVASLGCLLWAAAGNRRAVAAAVSGYSASVTLQPDELDRLAAAMALRPLALACWTLATGRNTVSGAADWWEEQRNHIGPAADRARQLLADRPPT